MKAKFFATVAGFALAVGLLGVLPTPRALAATCTWTGATSTEWKVASNWSGCVGTPANGDTVIIPDVTNDPIIATAATTSLNVTIQSGGILTNSSTGNIAFSNFTIQDGGKYIHDRVAALPGTVRSFSTGSTVEFLKNTATACVAGATYGNLIVDISSFTQNIGCGGNLNSIAGDLEVKNTSGFQFRLVGIQNTEHTIGGSLSVSGGTLVLSSGIGSPLVTVGGDVDISAGTFDLASSTGSPTLNIGGRFNQTGGTFTSSGTGVSTVVLTGGSAAQVTFATSGGTFTNNNINWQVASGKTVALNSSFGAGSWVNTNRTMAVDGALQINQGAYPGNAGAWSYGSGASLIFNNGSGSYAVGNDAWWPSGIGRPTSVNVQGAGGIVMNTARVVDGAFQTAAGVANGTNLTLNGIVQINPGGFFANSPVYGVASTLVYNTGDSYNVSNEWVSGDTVGSGVPKNVTIQNGTTVVLSAGAGSRTVVGDLTIGAGSSFGLGSTSGDDLKVGGNWINDGAFAANQRTVTFNGTTSVSGGSATAFDSVTVNGVLTGHGVKMSVARDWINHGTVHLNGAVAQTIDGTTSTTFDNLTINNAVGVGLGNDQVVNGALTLDNGQLTLGSNTLTLGPSASPVAGTLNSSNMIVADAAGALCKQFLGEGSFTYPVGDNIDTADYSPATLNFTGGSFGGGAQACVRVVDDKHPDMPGAEYITRYWVVTTNGITSYSCVTSFAYTDADVVGSETGLYGGAWNGSSWTLLDLANTTNNTFGGMINSFSDFSAGKAGPLAVILADFNAVQHGDAILVMWETTSELDNRGFNLYRGTSPAGPDRQLNTALIPSQSQGNPSGFVYTWEDRADLEPGTTYYYWLDDVDVNNVVTRHGPVSVDFIVPTAVTLGGMQASPAAGAAALPALWVAAAAGAALGLSRVRRRG